MKRTLYYSHPDFLLHDTGLGHPECAERLKSIEQALATPEFSGLIQIRRRWARNSKSA